MSAAWPRRIASLGGVGFIKPAPGTWGSAVVLPLGFLDAWAGLLACAVFTLAGLWALSRLPEAAEDPSWVVVDEAAGMALAVAFADGIMGIILAFALFRAFDIGKPGPVGWADRQPGAMGVMGDDLIAGAMAAVVLVALNMWVMG